MKLIKKILFASFRRVFYVITLPVSLIILLMSPIYRIRLIGLQSSRIGHYALNTELMLCAFDLGYFSRKEKTLFYNMSKPCNSQLAKMWKRVIPITPFSLLAIQIDQFLCLLSPKRYKKDPVKCLYESCFHGAIDKYGFLEKIKKPHLEFMECEKKMGKSALRKFGLKEGDKFVCLTVRDSGYLKRQYPETDWSYHDHRNSDVSNYKKATEYLADKGYFVFRMGKHVEKAFDVNHPNIIDYANHPLRSDFMDIYLCAHCEFAISTTTGLDCVSQIFRRPVLLTNISPVFAETLMWYPCHLFLPKLLKNNETGNFLPFSETTRICGSISGDILDEFSKRKVSLVENTPEQLLEAVIEMEARLTGKWVETSEDKLLQENFWEYYKQRRSIDVENIYIKITAVFLRNNTMMMC
ncbi:MAG: hypothetical protein A3F12_00520 [Gammaproteobacteria bacterium RIFCSPHIGHO2_12_FULL_38_14]|nr:MAG: hypothetical protein A3F12_00520 [Gammaproteobacteria bacterium RIFCSPHIGHO2_12_FULL_38_14]